MRKIYALIAILSGCGGGTQNANSPTAGNQQNPTDNSGNSAQSHNTDTNKTTVSGTQNPTQSNSSPSSKHSRCGWIGDGDDRGENTFINNASYFDTVHPRWWTLNPDGVTVTPVGHTDLATVVSAARTNHVRIMPLIDSDDADRLRNLIGDQQKIAAHVQTLVDLVAAHGYDGLDIDYEHLWSSGDRAGFVAFMTALSTAFHARGFELSMAIPGIGVDHGDSAYDYQALSTVVDALHVMGYDFHSIHTHLGPVAPLAWIDAVFAHAHATGHGDRFLLGVANYAIADNWFTTPRDALATRCLAPPATTSDEEATCTFDHYDAGRSLHCDSADHGPLWFEDVASMEEKIAVAQSHGARGVTYWTIGDELDGFFDMVRRHFP
jgi:spore germination protein YaaH